MKFHIFKRRHPRFGLVYSPVSIPFSPGVRLLDGTVLLYAGRWTIAAGGARVSKRSKNTASEATGPASVVREEL